MTRNLADRILGLIEEFDQRNDERAIGWNLLASAIGRIHRIAESCRAGSIDAPKTLAELADCERELQALTLLACVDEFLEIRTRYAALTQSIRRALSGVK